MSCCKLQVMREMKCTPALLPDGSDPLQRIVHDFLQSSFPRINFVSHAVWTVILAMEQGCLELCALPLFFHTVE